jgi:regulatory protein
MLETHDRLEIKRFCFQYLARREHSQLELHQKLSRKGFEKAEITIVLDEFVLNDWQSDQRFAESFFKQCLTRGLGPIRINYELRQRGITDEQTVMSEEDIDWGQHLLNVFQKKFDDNMVLTAQEWAKRLRFLQYRGFTTEMIRELSKSLGIVIK